MNIVGGLRGRLIRESLFQMLNDGLNELGWFDAGQPYSQIHFVSKQQNQNEQIAINTAALSDENDTERDVELGSTLTEQIWSMYVDFFAEDDAIGLHFIKDVRDILRGRFTLTTSKSGPNFDVFDYRQDVPPILFSCEVQNVDVHRANGFLKPWLEHWYAVSFEVVDYYNTESE